MTLGEFAKSVTEEIVTCAQCRSDVRDVIGSAAQLLADNNLPALQMRWFWQQVVDQMTAHRPIEDGEFTARLTKAMDAVMEEVAACGLAQ